MPQPERAESEQAFVERCMANELMIGDFPDEGQRAAVCHDIFRKARAEFDAVDQGHSITAEIFAVGTWNRMEFSEADLEAIAHTFHTLGTQHRVPLKFGHNADQPMTDGEPALGWVDNVWVQGGKLLARFVAVPTVVYNAIKSGRYRNVSIELDLDVEHRGQHYDAVLSGVALLGADLPAVNTLEDLTAYMTRPQRGYTASRRATFTAIGESDMPDDNRIEELEARLKSQRAEFERAEQERKDAVAKAEQLEAERKEREQADRKAHFKAKREEFTKRLDALVQSEHLLPAKRDELMGRFDEDEAKVEALEFTIGNLEIAAKDDEPPKPGERAHAGGGGGAGGDEPADMRFARECRKVASERKISFAAAAKVVADTDPKLHREYVDMDLAKEGGAHA